MHTNSNEKLSNFVQASLTLTVRATTPLIYKVEENKVSYELDLRTWTCCCREFDLDQIPCRHAVAAISVSCYFKQQGLVETYKEHIIPMPHPGEWNVPPEVSSIICLPPDEVRQAGRPQMSRARSVVENLAAGRRPQVCGRCKGTDHNRKSCKGFISIGDVDLNIPPEGRIL
ncbi:assists the folding of proteins upon ATP hydrolysis [Orobanche gracilis]